MKTLILTVTFNEAENVSRLVAAALDALPDADVLVVDDDSPDGTWRTVQSLGERDPRIKAVRRMSERGYGSAMILGLQYGIENGYEAVLTMDADFSHDPSDLPRLREALCGAEVVIGSRYVGGVRVLNWDVRRLLLSLAANAYVRSLSGLRSLDCTSGFRAYRMSVLKRVDLASIRTTGYAFLPHLLFELGAAEMVEVPICFTERQRGRSKMSRGVIAEAFVWPLILLVRRISRMVWTGASARTPGR